MKAIQKKRRSSPTDTLFRTEEGRKRLAALAAANRKLEKEITRRHGVESALKESESHQKLLLKQSEQMRLQLRDLSRGVLDAQEEERRRISRELHDEVLQSLVGINVHLENLSRESQRNASRLRPKIIKAQRLITASVNSIHRFARELRPMILDDLGLIPAIESFIADFGKRTAIHVQFASFPEIEKLSNTARTVIYRVIQSALTNIAQHAGARRVKIDIQNGGKTVLLKVHDNGRSFDVARTLNAKRYKRLGLLGMRERVEMIGGIFYIESVPKRGTTIRAEIPFGQNLQKKAKGSG